MRILVVEDNKIIRLSLENGIKKLRPDDQVIAVSDGIAALGTLYGQPIDLMITDNNLPGMIGLDLIRKVQRALPDLPIVLMSAQDIIELQAEVRRCHLKIYGFLSKPFTAAQLSQVINSVGIKVDMAGSSH